MSEQFFCNQTGEPLTSDIKWFRCLQCLQSWKIEFRYGDKPICQTCAERTGVAELLKQEQHEASSKEAKKTNRWEQCTEAAGTKLQGTDKQQLMELEGFRDNGNGTVLQLGTGLTWMRFSLGQQWVDGKAVRVAEVLDSPVIKNRIHILNNRNYLGKDTWRLPTFEELQSITVHSFSTNTLNNTIFPNYPNGKYITKTKSRFASWDSRFKYARYCSMSSESWFRKIRIHVYKVIEFGTDSRPKRLDNYDRDYSHKGKCLLVAQ